MFPHDENDYHRIEQRAARYRDRYPEFARWAQGYGVIRHRDETQVRVFDLCQELICDGRFATLADIVRPMQAADRLASAAMWLVVHMTYARRVDLSGAALAAEDFKANPQGHTGGSLNMVPAYVGYLAANALSGVTRSWLMGQGHCVAAIDAVNVLTGNLHPEQRERYARDDSGLTRLVRDFYSYAIDADGAPGVPLGSHVNPHTAGGLIEGGYLGFAELQYVHMPLPGERLVAFLSDGAFEEQRGSDWSSRWWRARDCGLVTPVMIANGRRIDQRSTMYQQGGLKWFFEHLQHNDFHPIAIDGTDPAAFAWGIFDAEARLSACGEQVRQGRMSYPVKLPYLIAEAPKGYGFVGAGTNAAHGTPLPGNPRHDQSSRQLFTAAAAELHVPAAKIDAAVAGLATHAADGRVLERDHPLACRNVSLASLPEARWLEPGQSGSPMESVDRQFRAIVEANPALRVRLGNPDELRSNRMTATLDYLKHRVMTPEPGADESIDGAVITALNEEAVVSAALANKGGLNLVVSYEAFAMKMVGALRQEIIFARQQRRLQRPPRWLSVPVIATSHLWENGKNEQSHQDSSVGEVLLGEMSDTCRVLYPADANSAIASLNACYRSQGQVWMLTIPKSDVANRFSASEAQQLVEAGALTVRDGERVQLVAVGAYQLAVCDQVAEHLGHSGIECRVTCLLEPGRFRVARDPLEQASLADPDDTRRLFPPDIGLRVFVCHLRPEVLLGICRSLDLGAERCFAVGYSNRGGTLDTPGMLIANGCDADRLVERVERHLGGD